MGRNYEAIFDEATGMYTLKSLNKTRKTGFNDIVTEIEPDNLEKISKAMKINIIRRSTINSLEQKEQTQVLEQKNSKQKTPVKVQSAPMFGVNNL